MAFYGSASVFNWLLPSACHCNSIPILRDHFYSGGIVNPTVKTHSCGHCECTTCNSFWIPSWIPLRYTSVGHEDSDNVTHTSTCFPWEPSHTNKMKHVPTLLVCGWKVGRKRKYRVGAVSRSLTKLRQSSIKRENPTRPYMYLYFFQSNYSLQA